MKTVPDIGSGTWNHVVQGGHTKDVATQDLGKLLLPQSDIQE